MSYRPAFLLLRTLAFGIVLFALAPLTSAQLPASAPIADPADNRFQGVTEDWTSPALTGSHLRAVPPVVMVDERSTYTVELIQVQWRWGDPLDLYVMKPKGVEKPPVVLYLYSYPADTDIFKSERFQNTVTKNGFAAVGFVSALTGHRYHDRPLREWFLSELQESLATSAHDVQMVLDYLSARGDLDMDRVGMFTQGSGASVGILASAVDPRIKVLDAVGPWGDWPTWMTDSPFVPEEERPAYVKPEFLKKVAGLEPLEWLPKIQAKKFRLQYALFETETPKEAQAKLRAAAPQGSTFVTYKTQEEFAAAFSGGKNLEWMQESLKSLSKPAAPQAVVAPLP